MASTLSSKNQSTRRKSKSSTDTSTHLSTQSGKSQFWRDSAPQGITGDEQWKLWTRHLEIRRTPAPLGRLLTGRTSPLLWGVNQAELSPGTVELLSTLDSHRATGAQPRNEATAMEVSLAKWLKECGNAEHGVDTALQALAVAHALPKLALRISSGVWWQLLDTLWALVQKNGNWRSDTELPPEQGWAQQLLVGELPLTLSYLFPEIQSLCKLRSGAADVLTEGLLELLNGEGLLSGPYLSVLRPLAGCWTRCRAIGDKNKKGCWKRKAEEQFQCFVTQAVRLTAADGSALLGGPHSQSWTPEFLQTLLRLGGHRSDNAAVHAFAKKKITKHLDEPKKTPLPEPAENCDWAGVAIMRTDWDRNAATVAVDYSTPDMKIEVMAGAQRIVAGTWDWQTTLNGQQLEPVGSWEEVCWFSDEDVDFLELAIELSDGTRLERQILLARDEMFLLLVDYVLEAAGGDLSHRQSWKLDQQITMEPEKETREALLTAGKPVARVMPLGLPEWRLDPRGGSLTCEDNQLVLQHGREGRNMACPLLFDLQKNRVTKQCTWRQLTVAESLEIQSPDVAVGYRAQCGKQQWLIYRSLAPKANRTFMGQNTSCECYVARFLAPSGEVEELLEVEG